MSLGEYAGAKRDVGAESGSGAATEARMEKVAASAVADQRQKDRSDRKQLRAPGELRIMVGGDLGVRRRRECRRSYYFTWRSLIPTVIPGYTKF